MRVSSPLTGVLLAIGAAFALSCSSDDETILGEPPPTEIAVDPLQFLGSVPCSQEAGAAQAFVAVLTDASESFTLAAGPPVDCTSRMAFRYIVIGHAYTAEVDVYDRPAASLRPSGGADSGSRVMVDEEGTIVTPRWRTRCGA